MSYVPRVLEKAVLKTLRQFPAVAVTGPRQSGKSTMLRTVLPGYRYLTFDDPALREQALSDPRLFLDRAGDRVILDEIQNAPQILSYLKMSIDARRNRTGRYVLTGSQQFALMRGLGDSLAGRIAVLELLPFDIREKSRVARLKTRMLSTGGAFVDACLRGSFPEMSVARGGGVRSWYAAYLQTYLERDIRSIYDIGSIRDFHRFMELLAARCSQVLNMSALAHDLGVAVSTVRRWVSVLEACRLIYVLPPYHNNLGKRVVKAPRVYFLDCGLVCYLTGTASEDYLLRGPLSGPLFENFCVQETVKVLTHNNETPRLFYVRTQNGLEVDLLIEGRGMRIRPVEMKMTKTPRLEMLRGITRFREIFKGPDIGPGILLTLDETEILSSRDGAAMKFLNYISWLDTL